MTTYWHSFVLRDSTFHLPHRFNSLPTEAGLMACHQEWKSTEFQTTTTTKNKTIMNKTLITFHIDFKFH